MGTVYASHSKSEFTANTRQLFVLSLIIRFQYIRREFFHSLSSASVGSLKQVVCNKRVGCCKCEFILDILEEVERIGAISVDRVPSVAFLHYTLDHTLYKAFAPDVFPGANIPSVSPPPIPRCRILCSCFGLGRRTGAARPLQSAGRTKEGPNEQLGSNMPYER